MRKITKIEKKNPQLPTRKKVAAYARVSKDTERLMNSISAQVSYYSSLIQNNPEWEYVGVYVDSGITGTLASKRSDFQRLLDDCEDGKIDIVLTKSISRFARNTVDLLETVRHLKAIGIEVRFEKERINTFSEDGELMLTLLASFAQEESQSISENVKWGIRKRFQSGEIGIAHKHPLGYKYDEQLQKYVIIPEEAETVRWMFQMFLEKVTFQEIADRLSEAGIRTVLGNEFQEATVRNLLYSEIYAGDIIRQKSYIEDPITKNKIVNNGELPKFYMRDCHESIIDRETYDKVKEEIARRGTLASPTYCFSRKIFCGNCGRNYTRKVGYKQGRTYVYWFCRAKKEKGVHCDSCTFKETELEKICSEILGLAEFDEIYFENKVVKMIVTKSCDIEFYLVGGEIKVWKNLHIKDWKHNVTLTDAFIGKIRCGQCGSIYHRVNSANKKVYWFCMDRKTKKSNCKTYNFKDSIIRLISTYVLGLEEFDEEVFLKEIKWITVCKDGTLNFEFYDGRVKHWQEV